MIYLFWPLVVNPGFHAATALPRAAQGALSTKRRNMFEAFWSFICRLGFMPNLFSCFVGYVTKILVGQAGLLYHAI